jgi:hypothetical protein
MKRFRLKSLFLGILFSISLFFWTAPVLSAPVPITWIAQATPQPGSQPQNSKTEQPKESPTPPEVKQENPTQATPKVPTAEAKKNASSYDMDAIQEFDRDIYGVK